jgi:hypothetical protein
MSPTYPFVPVLLDQTSLLPSFSQFCQVTRISHLLEQKAKLHYENLEYKPHDLSNSGRVLIGWDQAFKHPRM